MKISIFRIFIGPSRPPNLQIDRRNIAQSTDLGKYLQKNSNQKKNFSIGRDERASPNWEIWKNHQISLIFYTKVLPKTNQKCSNVKKIMCTGFWALPHVAETYKTVCVYVIKNVMTKIHHFLKKYFSLENIAFFRKNPLKSLKKQ